MKFNATYTYSEGYLPTKRHRILRYRDVQDTMEIEVIEVAEQDAPIALRVPEIEFLHKRESGDYRYYNNQLYKRERYNTRDKEGWFTVENLIDSFNSNAKRYANDTKESTEKYLKDCAENYIIINDEVWKEAGEPRYVCVTFGLGHNHGGTSLMLSNYYNGNISKDCYFNALERDKAIAFTKEVAIRRGDNESVDRIGAYYDIEVIMPEAVKCIPQIEAGLGDPFINGLERLIECTDSVGEAAILTMASTFSQISR